MKAVTKMFWIFLGIILASGIFFVLIDWDDTKDVQVQTQPVGK